jgi:hypothetical protein
MMHDGDQPPECIVQLEHVQQLELLTTAPRVSGTLGV